MNKQRGFSILEIFIGLALGSVLVAGVLSVFVGMRTTTEETSSIGELQENARFALNVLTDDLLRQGFWGDLPGGLSTSTLQAFPNGPAGTECRGAGTNNGTFPAAAAGPFRALWGATVAGNSTMSCASVNDAKRGSDLIQIKRAVTFPQPQNQDGSLVNALDSDRYYLYANTSDGAVFRGNEATPPDVENGRYWQYQHHVYYVRDEVQGGQTIPVLMQGRLTTGMTFGPLVEGIERIRFMYGVDSDGDGAVNAFISADNMTPQYWDNQGNIRILAVKIYVLARSIFPDADYENTQTYQMGDLNVSFVNGNGTGDNYRRLLLSSTVTLFNARVDTWQ
ncbi:PilW family protein [Endozoicomonas sp. G2_1]|uniref:PilW family protein n=1 Tax=Endozoicomonas sp. G2_1 TaxID=2821091 RepID=UPI001ADD2F1B|nr:PilW family protein [Endozoicomonas sp. G2_1]MBO9490150.1 PilW family protein [Endozoicomonas sp. G2_1]